MKKVLFCLMAVIAFAFTACNEQPQGPEPGTGGGQGTLDPNTEYSLTVNPTSFTLYVGEQGRINYTLTPNADVAMEFVSSDENVATVKAGMITAVAVGNATITVKVKGHDEISATATVNVLDKSSAEAEFAKINFHSVEFYGTYTSRSYPLEYTYTKVDEETGDTVEVTTDDINGDGTPDKAMECVMYILSDGIYMDSYGLTGEQNYVITIRSVVPYVAATEEGGRPSVYPFNFYKLSDDEDEYLVEHDGVDYLKFTSDAAYFTGTHFNPAPYTKYHYKRFLGNWKDWPKDQAEFDAFVNEYGYWLGDYDSQVGFLRVPEGSESYVQEPAGLIVGGNGFIYTYEEKEDGSADYIMPYLDLELEFFTSIDNLGLATEQAKDENGNPIFYDPNTGEATLENTGEPYYTFVIDGEGDDATFVMGPTVKRKFYINEYEQGAPRKAAPGKAKGISAKHLEANNLLNIPVTNILFR